MPQTAHFEKLLFCSRDNLKKNFQKNYEKQFEQHVNLNM